MKFIDEIKRKFSATVHIRCEAEVNEKIERLVLDGPDKLQIISNFDRTISKHIGYSERKKKIKCVYFLDGSAEAFNKLCVQNIPLIVMSVGIGDVVGLTLKLENLLTDNISIVANFLKVTKDSGVSTIHGYKGEKLIHIFNKNEHAYIEAHKNDTHLSGRFNVILLCGTLPDAIGMGGSIPFNTVLTIGFLNSDLMGHENKDLQHYKHAFDIVLVQDHTMGMLNYLLEKIIGETSTII